MKRVFFLFSFVFLICSRIISQTFLSGFQTIDIASGWNQPVGAEFSPDGQKLFVWEKAGKVFVCNRDGSGNYIKQTTPVIDISEEVGDWADHGLLGFAIDPSFQTNGYIYLSYVVDRYYLMNYGQPGYDPTANNYYSATIGRLTRYTTSISGGNIVADMASRLILIGESRSTGIPILATTHGVGSLVFADDGTLIVSTGDGADYTTVDSGSLNNTSYYAQALADGIIRPEENVGAFRSQMLNSLDGKLLRVNPINGNGMPSNPFYSSASPRSAKSRVWAFGFRNPFRFTIKPGTGSTNPNAGDIGEIYVGDVGWNTWEELDIIDDAAVNCGWPLYEGLTVMNDYYNLNTLDLDEPNPLYNGGTCNQQYFRFKDLLKQATADNIETVYNPCNNSQPIGTGNRYFHHRPSLDWKHYIDTARVGIFNGNNAAVATIGTPESGVTGSPFQGNTSIGGCWYTGTQFPINFRNTYFQADYGYRWLKSIDVQYVDEVQSVQTFASGFPAIVDLIQNSLDGTLVYVDIAVNKVRTIKYGGNQLPVVVMSSDKTYGPSVLNVAFIGSNSYDPDGTITHYSWNFGDGNTSTSANPSHNFSAPPNTPTEFVVKLTVTDDSSATSTDSLIISVNNTPPVVHITSPVNNSHYTIGLDTLYSCTANVTDAEQGPGQLSYAWEAILRHNNHAHPGPIDTARNTSTVISRIGCNGEVYYWKIILTVTDAAGLSTTDSSEIYPQCSGQGPLPILLSKFSVIQQGNTNLVKWTTEQEQNIAYFEVQRSSDGSNYFPIYEQAARNLPSISNYSYPDNGFSPGVNYYRLKIIELDGKISYSIIIKVSSDIKTEGLTIAPNPVNNNFAIIFTASEDGPVTISIRDVFGRLIQERNENISRGQNVIYTNGFEKNPSGLYFISIIQGNNVKYGKFIKAQ